MNISENSEHSKKNGVVYATNHSMSMLLEQVLKLIYQENPPTELLNLYKDLSNNKTMIKRTACENLARFLQNVNDNQINLIIINGDIEDLTRVSRNLLNNLSNLIKLSEPSKKTMQFAMFGGYNQKTLYNNDQNYINRLENIVNKFVTAIEQTSISNKPKI